MNRNDVLLFLGLFVVGTLLTAGVFTAYDIVAGGDSGNATNASTTTSRIPTIPDSTDTQTQAPLQTESQRQIGTPAPTPIPGSTLTETSNGNGDLNETEQSQSPVTES